MDCFNPCIFISSHIDCPVRIKLLSHAINSALNTDIRTFVSVSCSNRYKISHVERLLNKYITLHYNHHLYNLHMTFHPHQLRQFEHIQYLVYKCHADIDIPTITLQNHYSHVIFLDDDDLINPLVRDMYTRMYEIYPDANLYKSGCVVPSYILWDIPSWNAIPELSACTTDNEDQINQINQLDNVTVRDVDFSGLMADFRSVGDFVYGDLKCHISSGVADLVFRASCEKTVLIFY